jgi:hypothetical protein
MEFGRFVFFKHRVRLKELLEVRIQTHYEVHNSVGIGNH